METRRALVSIILLLLISAQADAQLTCPSGMISYWNYDETTGSVFSDLVGTNDASCTLNCPIPDSAGLINGSQFFSNVTEVSVPADPAFDWGPDDSFTLEVWFKPANQSNVAIFLGRTDNVDSGLQVWLGHNAGGRTRFFVRDSNSKTVSLIAPGNAATVDVWHHAVGVRDADTNDVLLYFDGQLATSAAGESLDANFSGNFGSATASLDMGWLLSSFHFIGDLDEIAIYDRVLSADEVSDRYNRGLLGVPVCQAPSAPEILSSPVTVAFVGETYQYDVVASGGPEPTFSLVQAPTGMTISGTGQISWDPPLDLVGTSHAVEVEALNSEGSDTQLFTLAVELALDPACPEDIISYWPFDEDGTNFVDVAGEYDAFCSPSTCPSPDSGLIDGGLTFDGSTTRVLVSPNSVFDFAQNESFTFEVWYKTSDDSNLEILMGRTSNFSNGAQVWLGHDAGGAPWFFVRDSNNNTVEAKASSSPSLNGWHHLVGVRDVPTASVSLYVDGSFVDSSDGSTLSGHFILPNISFYIGWLLSGFHFDGTLDEMAVYRRALTPSEIATHHANGPSGRAICESACPNILAQPEGASICQGESATFSVIASGTPPFSYQWLRNNVEISGATDSTLILPSTTPSDTGDYKVTVTNACGSTDSNVAVLSVGGAATVDVQPVDTTVCEGGEVTLSVSAIGAAPITYQWLKDGADIPGATTPEITLANTLTEDSGNYSVRVENLCGSSESDPAVVVIDSLPNAAIHTQDPIACEGNELTFTAVADGSPPFTYQWMKDNQQLAGAIESELTIDAALAGDAGSYKVMVTNFCGMDESDPMVLIVGDPPEITTQPIEQALCEGAAVTLSVGTTGTPPLDYHWFKDGTEVSSDPEIVIPASAVGDSGSYQVAVSNPCETVESEIVRLSVEAQPEITVQPIDQFACSGDSVTLSASVLGTGLDLQWRKDGIDIPDATASSYTIDVTTASDSGVYDLVLTNSCSTTTSQPARLTIDPVPEILTQPSDVDFCQATSVSFSVELSEPEGLNFQWRKDGADIPGANQPSLTIASPTVSDLGQYDVLISGVCGVAASDPADLVQATPVSILSSPSNTTACLGEPFTLTVVAGGDGVFEYSWRKNGTEIPGATEATFTVQEAALSDAGTYAVTVSNACNSMSSAADVTVRDCSGGSQVGFDCNQDGLLDIGDSVCLLMYLFIGDPDRLPCGNGGATEAANLDLMDFNGDRTLDIADVTSALAYMFIGGAPHPRYENDQPTCSAIADCPSACGL